LVILIQSAKFAIRLQIRSIKRGLIGVKKGYAFSSQKINLFFFDFDFVSSDLSPDICTRF
jgi:hypothetical protein